MLYFMLYFVILWCILGNGVKIKKLQQVNRATQDLGREWEIQYPESHLNQIYHWLVDVNTDITTIAGHHRD